VSQTPAALQDHRRRLRAAQEGGSHRPKDGPTPNPTPKQAGRSDKAEMSDARRKRLDRLATASKVNDPARDRSEDDPGRQNGAPGGGHTRSQ
jgi:hypothetical protein